MAPQRGHDPRYVAPHYANRGYVDRGYRGSDRGRVYYGRGSYYGNGSYYRGGSYYGRRPYIAPRFVHPHVVGIVPYRPYYYRPSFSVGVYYGTGGVYPYGITPRGYYDPIPGEIYGGIRITDAPRDAQVFADGYYVGIVDDFDGIFQHVNLEAGDHRIEIQAPGLAPVAFDVLVQPGRTMTLRADLY